MGSAKSVWTVISPVGVMTAARMKITSTAYFKFLNRKRAEIRPIFARKYTTAGIWKMSPRPNSILVYNPNTSSSRGMKARFRELKLPKKMIIHRNTM
jgi:hypothetical protein